MQRGYFAIGMQLPKHECNVGTLWRSADLLGAAFIFTIGKRYKHQASDTMKSWHNVPLFEFESVDELIDHLPYSCPLVGVELADRAYRLENFVHPERAAYLLGAEDCGLTKAALDACHAIVQLPGRYSMNVASAGSIVMYDRLVKSTHMTRRLTVMA